MKKALTVILLAVCFAASSRAGYVDHRGHNVDSLETVMSRWTADALADADEDELRHIASDVRKLMYGFMQTNSVKSEYFARMLLKISRRVSLTNYEVQAAKVIGQRFWASERYDSAAAYYGIAMDAVERMTPSDTPDKSRGLFSQNDIDDALSQMYGTLGNLYSSMDSVGVAMDYYRKAAALFERHGWHNSSAMAYHNMGETMLDAKEYQKAEQLYKESLRFAKLASDSLAIAYAYLGLGSLYCETGRTSKALNYLADSNRYFADHEDEELHLRMESLDFTEKVLSVQNRRLRLIILLLVALLSVAGLSFIVSRKLKVARKEKEELSDVLEAAVENIGTTKDGKCPSLKPREREVIGLIAKGYTNAEIGDAMCLSPDTIKWYKKKMFVMFDVANSAELVNVAKEKGLL